MAAHLLDQPRLISALLIGEISYDAVFVNAAKKLCDALHVNISPCEIETMMEEKKIDLIFGSLSSRNEHLYLPALKRARERDAHVKIILFLQTDQLSMLDEILALKCERYLSMKHESEAVLDHFKECIKTFLDDSYLAERHYFQTLIDFSIVSQTDIDGNITYINDNFLKVTGYEREELIGQNHRIIKHPQTAPEIFSDMWGTITQGEVWRAQIINRNKDGSDFWAETIIIPFKEQTSGKILQYLAIRHDITNFLQKERAANEISRKAQEQEQLAEAKDAFLVLFTHELKTPLNAILNFSQYLYKHMPHIDEVPKAKRVYLLEQIYKSASSMLENVTNILDLGKLRHQKLHYNLTLFNVKEAILDVLEKHAALAIEHKRMLFFQSDESGPFITSDEYRFKQILSNILSNAIKYGNSIVEVFLASDSEKIEIVVQDDGKGIKDKEEVFELYTQSASGTGVIEKKGTGIGLHFVKLLCEGLKLEYKIEDSPLLGGAKFSLTKRLKEQKNV
ncbi:PAS domain-containing sensor histidine kinase [Sulfurospirillum multivorans]|uniref:histidine kinase n=2 Tax=Sulfurospirillum multivorans TaxID=66821 RepID=A0AA86ANB1_SULMK|nr:HAMP domain-containing sensor histidine kinase [Sulfurospirillum multivorans]AHJ13970.1 putative histidine kinase [Sulfurospirillum multivorans DSM 12446]QEH07458.1 putative histidine kinase [Sulfurospirillum multivorans]